MKWLLGLGWSLLPAPASACALCFGAADNHAVISGFLWGGAMLLGTTFGILGALLYAVVRIERWRTEHEMESLAGKNETPP